MSNNRVWIELEIDHSNNAVNEKRAELANKLLSKLLGKKVNPFFYHQKIGKYCYGEVGFTELNDNGQWFDLEILVKDEGNDKRNQ